MLCMCEWEGAGVWCCACVYKGGGHVRMCGTCSLLLLDVYLPVSSPVAPPPVAPPLQSSGGQQADLPAELRRPLLHAGGEWVGCSPLVLAPHTAMRCGAWCSTQCVELVPVVSSGRSVSGTRGALLWSSSL